jgi:signal transduction histidine kinase
LPPVVLSASLVRDDLHYPDKPLTRMGARYLHSSTFRLALIYMALFGASVLLLLGFIYWSTAAYLTQQTDQTIEAEIADLTERYRMTGLAGLTTLISERLSRKPAGSAIYLLVDKNLEPLLGNLDRWPRGAQIRDGWMDFRLEGHGADGADIHQARVRVFRIEGGFLLLVGRDIDDLELTKQRIIITLAWGLAITLVLGGLGGAMMSRTTVRRIESINQTSREIISGDLSRRIPTRNTGDDFDVLADNLNAMLDRIGSLMEDVRRVSDNIAHDLRTPLARLRNRLEELHLQTAVSGANQEGIEQAVAEADRLLNTFNALLRIARIESQHGGESFTAIAMAGLVVDVAELYEPLMEEKRQTLALQLPESILVNGDRDLLFQAIANLMDNATKYTPAGGSIRVDLARRNGKGRLVIADNGPGIPEAAREKVFQRFFRLEQSRTAPGNGLGMSLVAAVVTQHRMSIRLEDNQPGLRVVIEFPVCESTDTGSEVN